MLQCTMRHPRLENFTLLGELLEWLVGWVWKSFVKLWDFTKEKMGKNKKTKVHKPKKGKGSYRREK